MRFNERMSGQMGMDVGDQTALEELEDILVTDKRLKLVVSDFDDTLSHENIFDKHTNNHHPVIDRDLVSAAHGLPLIIATATRFNHPKIDQIWKSGIVRSDARLITENGGVVSESNGNIVWSATEQGDMDELHQQVTGELPGLFKLPSDMQIIAKQGLTLMIVRAQHASGAHDPQVQAELRVALQETVGNDWAVTDSGRSLAVQRPGIDKMSGFNHIGLERKDYFIIGMGDSPNDASILDGANFAISVGERMADHADLIVEPDTRKIVSVLRVIGRTATSFNGWRRENDIPKGLY